MLIRYGSVLSEAVLAETASNGKRWPIGFTVIGDTLSIPPYETVIVTNPRASHETLLSKNHTSVMQAAEASAYYLRQPQELDPITGKQTKTLGASKRKPDSEASSHNAKRPRASSSAKTYPKTLTPKVRRSYRKSKTARKSANKEDTELVKKGLNAIITMRARRSDMK